jgi:CheY-like chemotaxis protein
VYRGAAEAPIAKAELPVLQAEKIPVLAVEDNAETLLAYESYLRGTPYQLITASSVADARRIVQQIRPAFVLLDILLRNDESTWTYLTELKSNAATRDIPIMVVTVVDNRQKARALGADKFVVKPLEREQLLNVLQQYAVTTEEAPILLVDDEEVSRYLLKGLLTGAHLPIVEADNARDALNVARQKHPRVIFLDLMMPEISGYELLTQLRSDPLTSSIPVIVNTSKVLSENERELLAADTVAILSKQSTSQQEALAAVWAALAKVGVLAQHEEAA